MDSISNLKYSPEMIEAVDQLDKCDFSYILQKCLKDIAHVEDIKAILDNYVNDEYISLAMEWFAEEEWIIYLQSRYNLTFHERIEYICFKPEIRITKNKNI